MKIIYKNINKNKKSIYKENKEKTGIYLWKNILNNKCYVGSALDIKKRLGIYFSMAALKNKLAKSNSLIYSAILKYGYSNFELVILEYCDKQILLEREQYYIDLLKPQYNILRTAGSRYGVTLSEKTKLLIGLSSKGRIHTKEAKAIMSKLAKLRIKEKASMHGKNHTVETRLKISEAKCLNICIKNIYNEEINIFLGNEKAASYLNVAVSTLRRYKYSKKVIKNKYLVYNL